eukprot:7328713-Pyramimonas_sp.AAC.1
MLDTRRVNDDPDGKAPRHSASPKAVGPERQTSNLADVMGMPVFKSEKSDLGKMPMLTAPSMPALPFAKSHVTRGPAVVESYGASE